MFACYTKWEEEEEKGRSKKGERWKVACNEGATAASAPLPAPPLVPAAVAAFCAVNVVRQQQQQPQQQRRRQQRHK